MGPMSSLFIEERAKEREREAEGELSRRCSGARFKDERGRGMTHGQMLQSGNSKGLPQKTQTLALAH